MTQSEALILQAIEKLSRDVAEIKALLGAGKSQDEEDFQYMPSGKPIPALDGFLGDKVYPSLQARQGTAYDVALQTSWPASSKSQPSPYSE